MAATELPAMRVAPECAEFASLVEALLHRRRSDPDHRRAAAEWYGVPRAWTRDELCDVAYSSYRALLRGAVRRPPRREVVMEIADYLQCTMTERNQLLVAARYAIEHPGPRGSELQQAVDALRAVTDKLPLPAYAVGRDWTILLINDHLLTVLGLALEDVVGLPPQSRNVLRLLFDPGLPVRALLEPDGASWSRLAAFSVMRFIDDNLLWQYDTWYRSFIARLDDLPDFSRYWQLAQSGELAAAAPGGLASARITVTRRDGRSMRMQPMNIDLLGPGYPGIVSFLAADGPTSQVLLELGVPSPANRWGAMPPTLTMPPA
jgi:PAS domain-containing protein